MRHDVAFCHAKERQRMIRFRDAPVRRAYTMLRAAKIIGRSMPEAFCCLDEFIWGKREIDTMHTTHLTGVGRDADSHADAFITARRPPEVMLPRVTLRHDFDDGRHDIARRDGKKRCKCGHASKRLTCAEKVDARCARSRAIDTHDIIADDAVEYLP